MENKCLRREAGWEEEELRLYSYSASHSAGRYSAGPAHTVQLKQVLQKHLCQISVFLHILYALSFTYLQIPQWTAFQDGLANKVNYKHSYYVTLKNYIFWW